MVHTASGGPSVSDIGIGAAPAGGVITNAVTSFPFTQDTYFDAYMQPVADACFAFSMELDFDWEVHDKSKFYAIAPTTGGCFNNYRPALLLDSGTAFILGDNDVRGFTDELGTKFIVSDMSGTLERQKLRKDKIKLSYRRYEAA